MKFIRKLTSVGLIISGCLISLQTSDMNPLLDIKLYREFLNKYYYNSENLLVNLGLITLLLFAGGGILATGLCICHSSSGTASNKGD